MLQQNLMIVASEKQSILVKAVHLQLTNFCRNVAVDVQTICVIVSQMKLYVSTVFSKLQRQLVCPDCGIKKHQRHERMHVSDVVQNYRKQIDGFSKKARILWEKVAADKDACEKACNSVAQVISPSFCICNFSSTRRYRIRLL